MKEKNHFDSKDIILLIVVLAVIYLFVAWFGNGGESFDTYNNTESTVETTQTAN